MAMKTEYDAPAPFDYEVWQPDPDWDCSPELQPIERDTLIKLAQYVVGRHKQNWSNCVRQRLSRLIIPLRAALKWMNAASTTTNSAIHDIILEMHRLEKNYWSWTQDDWLEVLCSSFAKNMAAVVIVDSMSSRLLGYCADLIDLRRLAAFIIIGFLSKFLAARRQRRR